MKKLSRPIIIPLILLIYLAAMAYIGWDGYTSGQTSALSYFGIIAICLVIIVVLHFTLKKRDALNRKRTDNSEKQS